MSIGLDMEIVRSSIDRIDVEIPWMSMFSEPTRVFIKGVHVEVVGKKNELKKKKRNFKIEEMGKLKKEALKQTEANLFSKAKEKKKGDIQEDSKAFMGLLYGVEVFIADVHLVYFDENEDMDILKVDIMIDHFKLSNNTSDGQLAFSSRCIKKRAHLSNLSISLDFLDQAVSYFDPGSLCNPF